VTTTTIAMVMAGMVMPDVLVRLGGGRPCGAVPVLRVLAVPLG
jgi:hypothetical protein